MASAIRSFMLPVGFSLSSFSRIRTPLPGRMLRKAIKEVLPMQCRIFRCKPAAEESMNDLSVYLHSMYIHISMSTPRQPRKTLRTDAEALVEACAGWNSRLAARRITQFLDRELAELHLTAAQLGLMAQIAVMSDDT